MLSTLMAEAALAEGDGFGQEGTRRSIGATSNGEGLSARPGRTLLGAVASW